MVVIGGLGIILMISVLILNLAFQPGNNHI